MTPELRSKLLEETKESAAAFVEDLTYMRESMVKSGSIRGNLRRLSSVMRRILIDQDGDIRRIAPPRIGKIMISGLDNSIFYRLDRSDPIHFFASGGGIAFGGHLRATISEPRSKVRDFANFNPDAFLELTQDGFLGQNVLCLGGKWATRRDVIAFVANVASGVHSGSLRTDTEHLLAKIRNAVSFEETMDMGDGPGFLASFNTNAIENYNAEFEYSPKQIDAVLFELLSAIQFFYSSPKVMELEALIKNELNL